MSASLAPTEPTAGLESMLTMSSSSCFNVLNARPCAKPIPLTSRLENKTEPPTAYIDSSFVLVGCVSCSNASPANADTPATPASYATACDNVNLAAVLPFVKSNPAGTAKAGHCSGEATVAKKLAPIPAIVLSLSI